MLHIFNEDTTDVILQPHWRQDAHLVVTGIASFRTIFESRSEFLHPKGWGFPINLQ